MIRVNKPVKLLEWGAGTNTTNQRWEEMGEGTIKSAKRKDGVTTLIVAVKGSINKRNVRDDSVKVAQLGEGMTPHAERWGKIADRWGEVAMGKLKSIDTTEGTTVINIEIKAATKVGKSWDV
jgi:hypothetical protein